MEQLAHKKYYTPEEYLALKEKADYKNDYYKGEIFVRSGGSVNRNLIIGNVHASLYQKMRDSKCFAFMNDVRLWIDEKDLFTYPDIMIVCSKIEFYQARNDTITNPLVIMEVLPKSEGLYQKSPKTTEKIFFVKLFLEYFISSSYVSRFLNKTQRTRQLSCLFHWIKADFSEIMGNTV